MENTSDYFMPRPLLFCMKSEKSVCYSVPDNKNRSEKKHVWGWKAVLHGRNEWKRNVWKNDRGDRRVKRNGKSVGKGLIYDLKAAEITPEGIAYVCNNSLIEKVKEFF